MEFTFNGRRQLELHKATTIPSGVDDHVKSTKREYDNLARLDKVTSYQNNDGTGTVRNQVVFAYTDYGALQNSWQSHEGAATTTGETQSPQVQYAYDTDATSSIYHDGLRLETVTYPNSRVVYRQYGTAADDRDDRLMRVSHLRQTSDTGTLLVKYARTGDGSVVEADYDQPDLRYDLTPGGTAKVYDGLDRFGRIKDLQWYDYGSSADAVRIGHGYDSASNRTWREDAVAAAYSKNRDEFYTYDGLRQLTGLERGDLKADKSGIDGSPFYEEEFGLEPLGNWADYLNKAYGTPYLDQDRTHNRANEITQIDGSSTHVAQDAAGNMTKVPTSWWCAHYDLVWDAWNRLVEVKDGESTVAAYEHDGLGRRITETAGGTTRHFYYSAAWQVLEERVGGSTDADRQFVWGTRYIDDLVLRDRDADSNSATGDLGVTDSGLEERLYALQDANFNVVALADTGGTIQERHLYSAYGTPSVSTGTFGSRGTSAYGWEYRYTARRYDLATGLYYYRRRPYHHELGRFLSRDPIVYGAGDPNLYRYVHSRPTSAVDPSGLLELPSGTVDFLFKDVLSPGVEAVEECLNLCTMEDAGTYSVQVFSGWATTSFSVNSEMISLLQQDPGAFMQAVKDQLPQGLKDALGGKMGGPYGPPKISVQAAAQQFGQAVQHVLEPEISFPVFVQQFESVMEDPLAAVAFTAGAGAGLYYVHKEGGLEGLLGSKPPFGDSLKVQQQFGATLYESQLSKLTGTVSAGFDFVTGEASGGVGATYQQTLPFGGPASLKVNVTFPLETDFMGDPKIHTILVTPIKVGPYEGEIRLEGGVTPGGSWFMFEGGGRF